MATTIARAPEDTTAVTHAARIEHVSKSFPAPGTPGGQRLAPDDITLDVAPGEFVTLLGASGCGKSTLLNPVAGPERRAEAERLLELVRLRGAYRKRVHELSGGMRQRVAPARTPAQDSRLLLTDEPFAGCR